jgi:6,7-dimethyl-8-ribityllumazine synthase
MSRTAGAAPMSAELRVALCVARFYSELADRLEEGARAALEEAGAGAVEAFSVPGAFELPLVTKYAAQSGRFDAIICLGAVIRGETDHYDYVCGAAAQGISQVQLETGVPCGFGVLTVDTMEQALDRVAGGSKRDTGRHAVDAALASLEVKRELSGRPPDGPRAARLGEAGSRAGG